MADLATGTSAQITPFLFETHTVRVVMRDGEPWFVASDVCAALGYEHVPHAMRMLDDDEKEVHILDTLGGQQKAMLISESGLFTLVLRSRKPEARKFVKWVTQEVLPSIRKTGGYGPALAASPAARIHAQPEPAIDPAALLLSGQSSMPLALSDAQQAALDKQAWLLAHEAYTLARQHIVRRIAYKTTPAQRAARPSCVQDVIAGVTLGNTLAHAHHHELRSILRAMQVARDFAVEGAANLETLIKDGL